MQNKITKKSISVFFNIKQNYPSHLLFKRESNNIYEKLSQHLFFRSIGHLNVRNIVFQVLFTNGFKTESRIKIKQIDLC